MSSLFFVEIFLLFFAFAFLAYGLFRMRQPLTAQLFADNSQTDSGLTLNQFDIRTKKWK